MNKMTLAKVTGDEGFPGISGELFGFKHVLPERPAWYQCACCPPNVARLLTSLGQYAWSEGKNTIYSHLSIGGSVDFFGARISVESKSPWEGSVIYRIERIETGKEFILSVRIPSYAENAVLYLNGEKIDDPLDIRFGYCYIKRNWKSGDSLQLLYDMPVRRIYSNTLVRENIGCVALLRGPIVYCFEEKDNGKNLQELWLRRKEFIEIDEYDPELLNGIVPLKMKGVRIFANDELYFEGEFKQQEVG